MSRLLSDVKCVTKAVAVARPSPGKRTSQRLCPLLPSGPGLPGGPISYRPRLLVVPHLRVVPSVKHGACAMSSKQVTNSGCGLLNAHAVADHLQRGRAADAFTTAVGDQVGDPSLGPTHHPLGELGTEPGIALGSQLGGVGCRPGHPFPAVDGWLVLVPDRLTVGQHRVDDLTRVTNPLRGVRSPTRRITRRRRGQ